SLIQELISTVDGYVREVRRFLITEIQFRRGPDGKLDLTMPEDPPKNRPSGDPRWSDQRCETIRELVAQLLDPDGAPVLSESLFFISLRSFWRKKEFVHRREAEIESGYFTLKKHENVTLCRELLGFRPHSVLSLSRIRWRSGAWTRPPDQAGGA